MAEASALGVGHAGFGHFPPGTRNGPRISRPGNLGISRRAGACLDALPEQEIEGWVAIVFPWTTGVA